MHGDMPHQDTSASVGVWRIGGWSFVDPHNKLGGRLRGNSYESLTYLNHPWMSWVIGGVNNLLA